MPARKRPEHRKQVNSRPSQTRVDRYRHGTATHQQRVAAIARPDGPDLLGVWEVRDVLLVALGPRHVLLSRRQRGTHAAAGDGRASGCTRSILAIDTIVVDRGL